MVPTWLPTSAVSGSVPQLRDERNQDGWEGNHCLGQVLRRFQRYQQESLNIAD